MPDILSSLGSILNLRDVRNQKRDKKVQQATSDIEPGEGSYRRGGKVRRKKRGKPRRSRRKSSHRR